MPLLMQVRNLPFREHDHTNAGSINLFFFFFF
jgi:hypothetical protein